MDLLLSYQNELLGVVAIIIVVIIYLLVIKKRKLPDDREIESKLAETKVQQTATTNETSTEEVLELEGNEEGEFIPHSQEFIQNEEQTNYIIDIVKKDVPPHEKVTKEDFKQFKGQRILVAEDNLINQKVILGLLADSGIDVVIANDGIEALEILQKDSNFTLILMDAHMPRMDGFETTRNIRKNPKYNQIVVIALSGDTAADDIRKMKEAGMSEHLEKPLKIDALYDMLYTYSRELTPTALLEKTFQELDIEEGLEVSGNDLDFFHEILQEFLSVYEHSDEKIETYLKQKNIQETDRLLLDLSGVAANIGAKKLQHSAQKLKAALNENSQNYLTILSEFKESLQNLTKEIKTYLSVE